MALKLMYLTNDPKIAKIAQDVSALPVYGNTYFDFYNKKIKNLKTSALYQWTHGLRDATIE